MNIDQDEELESSVAIEPRPCHAEGNMKYKYVDIFILIFHIQDAIMLFTIF